jgi:hypothetical protein
MFVIKSSMIWKVYSLARRQTAAAYLYKDAKRGQTGCIIIRFLRKAIQWSFRDTVLCSNFKVRSSVVSISMPLMYDSQAANKQEVHFGTLKVHRGIYRYTQTYIA